MKQTLYILIGVLISAFLMLPFAQSTDITCDALKSNSTFTQASDNATEALATCRAASPSGTCFSWNQYVSGIFVQGYGYTSDNQNHWFPYTSLYPVPYTLPGSTCTTVVGEADSDGDGIPDKYDLKPDSSSSYKAGIISVCYDQNHKVVAGIIQDGEGNQYSFGTMPTDFEGYTIESVTGDLITYQTGEDLATTLGKLNIDNLNITKQNSPVEIQDDGTIIPGSTDPFKDYKKAEEDQTTSKKPTVQPTPTVTSQETDTDSKSLKNIVDNTNSTNKNLENMQGYLQITNDNLAQINRNLKNLKSNSTGTGTSITVDTPTAEEIGQAVEDQLIDSGQTIDTTTTDNITSLDETDTLTEIKTKYSDRYDFFINTLKGSDLFTEPFDIFTGPSGSGSSVLSVNIGSWGQSSSRTVTIDFSQYDNVWNILSSVLLMLTSFACFKIIVLKKA